MRLLASRQTPKLEDHCCPQLFIQYNFYIWRYTLPSATMPMATGTDGWNPIGIPTLLYNSELWINRDETVEIFSWFHPIRRSEKWRQNICSITEQMEIDRNNWYEHIVRMSQKGLPPKLYNYRPFLKRYLDSQWGDRKINSTRNGSTISIDDN